MGPGSSYSRRLAAVLDRRGDVVESLERRLNMGVFIALNVPKSVGKLLALARSNVERMQGQPFFPSPNPALSTISAAIDDLAAAEAHMLTRAKGAREARDAKRVVLHRLLKQLAAYILSVAYADGNDAATVIESTGFAVKRPSVRNKAALAAARGATPGTVILRAKSAGDRAAYEWRYSTDQVNWIFLPTTVQSSTTVTGLVAATEYFFQCRVQTPAGRGDWGDVVSFIMT
jgi:hypothetical protein